jgi:hypothetical protein
MSQRFPEQAVSGQSPDRILQKCFNGKLLIVIIVNVLLWLNMVTFIDKARIEYYRNVLTVNCLLNLITVNVITLLWDSLLSVISDYVRY